MQMLIITKADDILITFYKSWISPNIKICITLLEYISRAVFNFQFIFHTIMKPIQYWRPFKAADYNFLFYHYA